MKKKNPRIGSSLESWLDEAGIREDVTVAAIGRSAAGASCVHPHG